MMRFFDMLNTPRAVAFVLAFFLFVDGFLFYRYQQNLDGNNTRIIIDAEAVAAEEALASVEQESDTPEEPISPTEAREPATEKEASVPTEPPPTTEEGTEVVRLVVGVTGAPSWLRVQEDRQIVLDQLIEPGFSREFVADRAINVRAGNAGAVQVEVDGRDLGALGADGEVATSTYTAQSGREASE